MKEDGQFRLKSCCCCCSLKTGSIFSGIACIVLAVITIILLFTFENLEFHTIIVKVDTVLTKIVLTVNLIMTCLVSLMLLVGIFTNRTSLMTPWVVLGILVVLGVLVSVIYTSIVYYLKDDEVYHYWYGTFALVFGLIGFGIYAYFWFVTYSYYMKLRQQKSTMKIGPFGRPYSYQRS